MWPWSGRTAVFLAKHQIIGYARKFWKMSSVDIVFFWIHSTLLIVTAILIIVSRIRFIKCIFNSQGLQVEVLLYQQVHFEGFLEQLETTARPDRLAYLVLMEFPVHLAFQELLAKCLM